MRLLAALALCALAAATGAEERRLDLGDGRTLAYQVLSPGEASPASALPVARRILEFLAAGDLEAAAALSNAPQRRLEVLRDYRASVGESEFRRIFARLLAPENPVLAELAIGNRRLILWDLGEADHQLAAQYYVETDGGFRMDDVPGEARANLTRVLRAWRAERNARPAKPSGRTD